jgi:octopine/nopaline transport system permease protein
MNAETILSSFPALLDGVPLTLELAATSVLVGLVLATGLAVARQSHWAALREPAKAYVFIFRGTPLLVQLFLLYYGLPQFGAVRTSFLWPIFRDPFWCSSVALALNTAAYASEIIRGGVLSVPLGHIEAAKAVGMSRFATLRRIIVPVVVRQALPAYGNEVILVIKGTSLASTVTLLEVTGIARQIIARSYAVFEVFAAAGVIYLVINIVAVTLVRLAEAWMHPERRQSSHRSVGVSPCSAGQQA